MVAINDALPFKAARRRNAIAKLIFGGSNLSCRQTQCRFILSGRGRHLNAA